MLDQLQIARALKDNDYFHSLQPSEQEAVVSVGGIGPASITDEYLESVSSGLEGGAPMMHTTSGPDEAQAEPAVMVVCTC